MPTLPLDLQLFRLINDLAGTTTFFSLVAIFFSSWLIFVLWGAVIIFAWRSWRNIKSDPNQYSESKKSINGLVIAVRTVLTVIFASIDSFLLSLFLVRSRPFLTLDQFNLLIDPPLIAKSFPSDHASISFAIAITILLVNRRWGLLAIVVAVLVSIGRVAVGVHYPMDVLAGAILGSFWALIVAFFGKRFNDREYLRVWVRQFRTRSKN